MCLNLLKSQCYQASSCWFFLYNYFNYTSFSFILFLVHGNDQSNLSVYVNEEKLKILLKNLVNSSDLFIYRGIGFSTFLIVFMFMLTGVYYFLILKKIRKMVLDIIFSIWFLFFRNILNYPISSDIGYELFEINLYIGYMERWIINFC